jgi:hypothetical protein
MPSKRVRPRYREITIIRVAVAEEEEQPDRREAEQEVSLG